MRAQVLQQPRAIQAQPLREQSWPDPKPGTGQLRLRVKVCGICRTDLHVVEGELPPRLSPVIPGHQIVGQIDKVGEGVSRDWLGQRVGVGWLHHTCGRCKFCRDGRENLCQAPHFTGWSVHGGFAEHVLAQESFVYPLPEGMEDVAVAPLLCAGIIGYRCLKQTGITRWEGSKLGIYGFGAAGHVAIQVARARGAEVFVCTRDQQRHQKLAAELGAAWVGGATDAPPAPLDASVIFAPAGELVPPALSHLDEGGTLVLGGIYMSDVPQFPYELLYRERGIRSVTNNTREDGVQFLEEAARIGVRTHTEVFPLEQTNRALMQLKDDGIRGAGVIRVE